MNSLVPPEVEDWNNFGGCDNSFDNLEGGHGRDKEILPNIEMMDHQESPVTTASSLEETLAPKFIIATEPETENQP